MKIVWQPPKTLNATKAVADERGSVQFRSSLLGGEQCHAELYSVPFGMESTAQTSTH